MHVARHYKHYYSIDTVLIIRDRFLDERIQYATQDLWTKMVVQL